VNYRQHIDTAMLKTKDIAAVIQRDLGPALISRNGHLRWRCPFHEDHDPSLDVNIRLNRAFCNPCGLGVDAVGWLMKYRKLDFPSAARELGALKELPMLKVTAEVKQDKAYAPPNREWLARTTPIIRHCIAHLWGSDAKATWARNYLYGRGLSESTLRHWHIGYNPEGRYLFGLWLSPGVIIPAYMDGVRWGIKIRLLPDHPFSCQGCNARMTAPGNCPRCGKQNKYRAVKGSEPALFGADTCRGRRVAFGCEGEFDAMLTWQNTKDLGGVFTTTNGAAKDWRPEWSSYLLDCERIILLLDNDEAGDRGKSKLAALGERVSSAKVPAGKDVTEYAVNHQGNIFQWLNLERRSALCAGFESTEAEIGFLREQLKRKLPAELYADYSADLAELEER
jgi:hypothetical protein